MTLILDDISCASNLYPFTANRSVVDIRVGMLTIREKWQLLMGKKIGVRSEFAGGEPPGGTTISADILPDSELISLLTDKNFTGQLPLNIKRLKFPWEIFENNDLEIRNDFSLVTRGRQSQAMPAGNTFINAASIFIEEGAKVHCSILNATTGPIYIGKNAEVLEGCLIRGPFSLGEGSLVKMGAKIYGATSTGPSCLLGGEIKNSVFFGFSNKAHDGYLGDSVIGEWCNLGAGTSTSNIKNTAGSIRPWSSNIQDEMPMLTKCGLLMGDYSRAAINTSFNTGTIVGVCCNIFTPGFPPKYVSDFTWGMELYKLEKAFVDIDNWKKLKGHCITDEEKKSLSELYSKLKINHA